MKKLLFFLLCFYMQSVLVARQADNIALSPYVDFLQKQNVSAKNYILSQFHTHDIVILCERLHPEFTQYELIADVLADKYFIENVGILFTEIGCSNLSDRMNKMFSRNFNSEAVNDSILEYCRNASFFPIWENYNYYFLLKTLYKINSSLSLQRKIQYFPSDMPFNWQSITNTAEYDKFFITTRNRDSIIASQIFERYDKLKMIGKTKALIILNYRHAFNNNFYAEFPGKIFKENVAYYLFQKYHEKVSNIMLNNINIDMQGLLQEGKWDAAFSKSNKNNIGFDFVETQFGNDHFDYWDATAHTFQYQDIFNGFVYYKPPREFLLMSGIDGIVNEGFKKEINRRFTIAENSKYISKAIGHGLKAEEEIIDKVNKTSVKKLNNLDSLKVIENKWL